MEWMQDEMFLAARRKARSAWLRGLVNRGGHRMRTIQETGVRMSKNAYRGVRAVPVAAIVGSECRADEFDRNFMPRKSWLAHRWLRVNAAFEQGVALPAVKLLEVAGQYFVRDGNHRVSVAKLRGIEFLDADVVQVA